MSNRDRGSAAELRADQIRWQGREHSLSQARQIKESRKVGRNNPTLGSILPLLDLMAANHAVRSGMEIPPSLKREMDRRHRVLARRYPNPSRIPEDIRRGFLASIPKPTAEVREQHEAEWLARAKDVVTRYSHSPADADVRG